MKKVIVLMAVLAVLGLTTAVQAEVTNGDFEGGSYDNHGQQTPNDWDSYWNSLDFWGSTSVAHSATEGGGNNFAQADVAGTEGGGFAVIFQADQTLAGLGISPGDTVNLSADIIDLIGGGGGGGAILKVESWDDTGTAALDMLEVVIGGVTGSWSNFNIDYTVAAGATKLTAVFGTSTGWAGPNAVNSSYGFDNVSLVPEPMTIALLGLGGLFLRRRRA